MLDWISENYTLVTSLANLGMLLVWIFYAQLLYVNYRRQRLPRVLINKGVGEEYIDSPCLVCNMSEEPVFVYFVMVKLKTDDGVFTSPMTDREGDELPRNEQYDRPVLRDRTRQGPLHTGECLEFVSFRRMIQRVLRSADIDVKGGLPLASELRLQWIELHVICIYGPESKPFGAVRRFLISAPRKGLEINLYPDTLDTATRRSSRYRRRIDSWLRRYL